MPATLENNNFNHEEVPINDENDDLLYIRYQNLSRIRIEKGIVLVLLPGQQKKLSVTMTKFLSMFGCLRYLCLFTHSGVQHLLWFVFAL